jgi:hypothetical protein
LVFWLVGERLISAESSTVFFNSAIQKGRDLIPTP